MSNLRATLGYVKRFAGTRVLIKLGGAVLQDQELVKSICEDLMLIQSVGVSVVIVHGGGPAINEELTRRGIQWEFVGGQRVTSPEMMETIEMVLCGGVNRRIVRTLNQAGVPAVGLSGVDASTLLCKQADKKLGLVGKIEKVNTSYIDSLKSVIPVIAPVGIGRNGEVFNINADWAASKLAEALKIDKLLFLTDQEGILDREMKLIPELDAGELESLIETGVVKGGMMAKTQTIIYALQSGVANVHVLNARRPNGLIEELFTDTGVGTVCRLRSRGKTTYV